MNMTALLSAINYKPLSYYLTSDFMLPIILKALAVGLLVCLCCSLLGTSLVLKRFSMIGDGLSHTGFGALAVASVMGATGAAYHITLPIVTITAFFLLRTGENSKIRGDTAIAVLSTGAVAFGSLLYNFSDQRFADLCNSLFGSAGIFTISNADLVFSILVSVAVLVLFVVFYNRIFAITFDETYAGASGINASLYKSLIAVLTAVTVVVGMKMMGSIMISGLIIFPALAAMRVCKSFKGVVIGSALTGIACFLMGFFTAICIGFQTGPTVIVFNVLVFLIFTAVGFIRNTVKRRKNEKLPFTKQEISGFILIGICVAAVTALIAWIAVSV